MWLLRQSFLKLFPHISQTVAGRGDCVYYSHVPLDQRLTSCNWRSSVVFLLTVLGELGKVIEESNTLILACCSICFDSLLRTKFMATKELRAKAGSFFHVDRSLTITITVDYANEHSMI